MVKKIVIYLFLSIPFLFIKNVYAESLQPIYTLSTNYDNIKEISNTSFGDYSSINFSVFDKYNYTYQYNGSNTFFTHYLLLYNKEDNYYMFIATYADSYTSDGVFNLSNSFSSGSKLRLCHENNLSSGYGFAHLKFIYNNEETRQKINEDFTLSNAHSTNLDNFYILPYSVASTIYNQYMSVLYSLRNKFYYIDSSSKFYINEVEQTKTTYEELNQPEPEPVIPPYNFNNNKYYVPNYTEGNCVEIIDKDTIRVFENESTNFYIDYYINSNYISRQGQVDLEYEKHCSNLQFTDIRYYGNDMPQILFILVCILTFTIGFPYVLYKRFRKR